MLTGFSLVQPSCPHLQLPLERDFGSCVFFPLCLSLNAGSSLHAQTACSASSPPNCVVMTLCVLPSSDAALKARSCWPCSRASPACTARSCSRRATGASSTSRTSRSWPVSATPTRAGASTPLPCEAASDANDVSACVCRPVVSVGARHAILFCMLDALDATLNIRA